MSRAFMREPEPGEPPCPGCGTPGDAVGPSTLEAHLTSETRGTLGDRAFYCVATACPVGYFNGWGTSVAAAQLTATAWPKDSEGPICPCSGLKAADVASDAREGRKDRVKALLARSSGPDALCGRLCPDGKPCIARVFRLFRETFETK